MLSLIQLLPPTPPPRQLSLGAEKENKLFFCTSILNTPRGPGHPSKVIGHPRFPPFKPKESRFSREGTNFSTTTPLRERSPPHPAISGPKQLFFVLLECRPGASCRSIIATPHPSKKVSCSWLKMRDWFLEWVLRKGFLRRYVEGRSTPFQEYDPLRVP